MNDQTHTFYTIDSVMLMWIAGGLAAVFIFFVLFDGIRAHRKHTRRAKSIERRAKLSREANLAESGLGPPKAGDQKPAA